MGVRLTNERAREIVQIAFEEWVFHTERRVWRCIELKIPLGKNIRLGMQSTKLVTQSSRRVLGKEKASELSKPQIERLRDDLELHGRRQMEAFMRMREPWVVNLARLMRLSK